jgi:hypothetical protein
VNHKIHHLAVWVLVVIHFFVGLGWYALFGEAWLNYNARTMTDIEPPHSAVPYLIAIIAAIVVNYGLAWLFAKLHVVHAFTGLKIALVCWFVVLVCPIREYLRVLSVRNKSLATHSHQHGPPPSRLRH